MNYKTCEKCATKRNTDEAPECPVCILPPETAKRSRLPTSIAKFSKPRIYELQRNIFPLPVIPLDAFAEEILVIVAERYGVDPEKILSYGKRKVCGKSLARRELVWLLRKELKWTLTAIGAYIHRDHTTVLYNLKQYEQALPSPTPSCDPT